MARFYERQITKLKEGYEDAANNRESKSPDSIWYSVGYFVGKRFDNPILGGTPIATTPPAGDDSPRVATTGWVKAAIDEALGGGGSNQPTTTPLIEVVKSGVAANTVIPVDIERSPNTIAGLDRKSVV
jgi:hypothetical protein